ncbi:YcjF family protein [Planctomycetes bacterium K23_9]|uniref:DUF697 domain-containing protein n=1 Tax=Stieleria marina TaxID=1930275 RepID=A0A517P0L5_9BACT|nr:hypothetical protein K239x_49170 [Planctomycetes bacterium K23_9]
MAKASEAVDVIDEVPTEEEMTLENEPSGKWNREQVAQSLVRQHCAAGAASGFIPVPGGDVIGISASALNMIKRLSDLYEVKFTREAGLNVIMALASAAVPLALKATAASLVKSIPGVGTYAGAAAMSTLGGTSVFAIGQVMIRHYESGGDLLNLDAKKAKEYFREHFAKEKGEQAEVSSATVAEK